MSYRISPPLASLQDVYGHTGDLSTSPGQLFSQAYDDGVWTMLLGPATLRVTADDVPGFLRYGLQVSSASSAVPDAFMEDSTDGLASECF
eukprot:s241_g28.t1